MSNNFYRKKFNNSRTYVINGQISTRDAFQEARLRGLPDAYSFHSKAEALRYLELRELVAQGRIKALRLQPRFDLYVKAQKITRYIADFEYEEGNQLIVEDVKGMKTPEYKLKSKLFMVLYCHSGGIRRFRETKAKRGGGFNVEDFPVTE